jgi:hypothetical protein
MSAALADQRKVEEHLLRDLSDWFRHADCDWYGSFDSTDEVIDEIEAFAKNRLLGPL